MSRWFKYGAASLLLALIISHLAYGSILRVPVDYATLQAAVSQAENDDTVLVADGRYTGPGNYNIVINRKITVVSEHGPYDCTIDCESAGFGFSCYDIPLPGPLIQGFTITNGYQDDYGCAIQCEDGYGRFVDCIITNSHGQDYHGAAVTCIVGDLTLINCIIAHTQTNALSALHGATINAEFCTFVDVTSYVCFAYNEATGNLSHCICNGYGGLAFEYYYSQVNSSYCFTTDPLFEPGPHGSCYLSQIQAGQSADSPCLDLGGGLAMSYLFTTVQGLHAMSEGTTRTDEVCDAGIVDLGYHYTWNIYGGQPQETPTMVSDTPTMLPKTPTPALPSATPQPPTPSPLPSPIPTETSSIGVDLSLSLELFHPGDRFLLVMTYHNYTPHSLEQQTFSVLLDVYSSYFWYPTWEQTPECVRTNIPIGATSSIILDFEWPQTQDSLFGILFYGALVDHELTQIIGDWDSVEFGYESAAAH